MNPHPHRSDSHYAQKLTGLQQAFREARGIGHVDAVRTCLADFGGTGALDLVGTGHAPFRLRAAEAFYDFGMLTDASTILSLGAHVCAGIVPVLEFGRASVRDSIATSIQLGQRILANAITEIDAGSDLTNLRTTAVHDGETYVLNGAKRYVTNAALADYAVVFCSTDPEAGFLGCSALLVDLHSPGVSIGAPCKMVGVPYAQVAPITFTDCTVPAENLLGMEGDGTKIFAHSMLWERTVMFSGLMGVLQRNLELAVDFAGTRFQHRVPIARFQAVSHRLANSATDIEACRSLIASAVAAENEPRAQLLSMHCKVACSEAFIRVARNLVATYGGLGLQESCPASGLIADSMAASFFSGSNDVLRNAIASKMGL